MTSKERARTRMLRNGLSLLVLGILVAGFAAPASAAEGFRRVRVGEIMPEFTLTGVDGGTFAYQHKRARVLGIIILQATHGNSERVVADVRTLVQDLRTESPAFDCVGVVSGPGGEQFIRTHSPASPTPLFLATDPNFAFWGKLGVIAAPTAAVVGSDGKIQWIRAGFGYDFIASLHAQLRKALGLTAGDASVHVEILENASTHARQERLIQFARTLARKGRMALAADELQKAYEVDPNATEVALELGEMLCRAGKNEAALKMATATKTRTSQEKAQSLLIRGWARRQMEQLDEAESLLKDSLELNPRSARALYEMGKVYESTGNTPQALECYRRGLAEVLEETVAADSSHE